ncbi:hypothetical protein GCM10027056_26830 [Glaciibacter psychrotolerans]
MQSVMANAAEQTKHEAALSAAASAQAAALRLQVTQARIHVTLATAFATRTAEAVANDGTVAIAAAAGKTDATVLAASVTELSKTTQISTTTATAATALIPDRVMQLAARTEAATASVRAATAEVDRVAGEQAAAAAAAAQAAAAAAEAAAQAAADEKAAAAPSRPAAPTDPSGAQAIARDLMLSQYGWGDDEFGCLVSLWNKESGWNVNAYNSSSGAAGIPQALPGSKMASAGADWQTNPATQITWGLGYIAGRYGTPCGAWDHSVSNGWY